MHPLQIVALVVTILGTAYSVVKQEQAADEAEDIAQANARREQLEAEEEAQRLADRTARESSLIKAIAAASGAEGGSKEAYLREFEDQRSREINWIRKSGASRASITRAEGGVAKTTAYAQMGSTLIQGSSQALQWYDV